MSNFQFIYPNKIRNAIIRANKPIASVSAKPKIVNPNNCCLKDGFRAKEFTKAAKTIPIPMYVFIPMPDYLIQCQIQALMRSRKILHR